MSRISQLDFTWNIVSITLNYSSIFLFYHILAQFDDQASHYTRWKVLGLATLQLGAFLGRGEANVLHLYFGRRAGTRVRQILSTLVVDKALKRPIYSSLPDSAPTGPTPRSSRFKRPSSSRRSSLRASSPGFKSKLPMKLNSVSVPAHALSSDTDVIVDFISHANSKITNLFSSSYLLLGAPFEIALCWVLLTW